MEISIRLSSGLAQYVGNSRLRVSMEEGATVADLIDHLGAGYPTLAESLTTTVAVIAGRHVDPAECLSDGQEVALLIPISGGCS